MRIDFQGRAMVVRQVQTALGLKPDGDDRRVTWQAIAERLPLIPVPQIPPSPRVDFPTRREVVSRVQRFLGATVDGRDGQETWAALAERFDPSIRHLELARPIPTIHATRVDRTVANAYTERVVLSPNISRRKNGEAIINERKGLILHHAAGYYDGTVSWCANPRSEVSYHCLIALDGRRTTIADDSHVAWHAGKSVWKGRSGCNAFALGLSFTGNTNTGAMRGDAGAQLTPDEIASAAEWIRPRMARYGWTLADITTHARVSPGRKDDTSHRAMEAVISALA